jgi:hypothetical protein
MSASTITNWVARLAASLAMTGAAVQFGVGAALAVGAGVDDGATVGSGV